MSKKLTAALKKLSADEREKRLVELRLELMKDRGQAAAGTAPKKTAQIRNNRKTVARILTLRHE